MLILKAYSSQRACRPLYGSRNGEGKRERDPIVSDLTLTDCFSFGEKSRLWISWSHSSKVFQLVEQDKKPALSITYEAMDRAKLALKATIKHYQWHWKLIDRRWECKLYGHLQAAVKWIFMYFYFLFYYYDLLVSLMLFPSWISSIYFKSHISVPSTFSSHPQIRAGLKESHTSITARSIQTRSSMRGELKIIILQRDIRTTNAIWHHCPRLKFS